MRNVRLSRLLAQQEIAEIVQAMGCTSSLPLGVYNESGELISGDEHDEAQEFPVLMDGNVIGVVSGDMQAATIAKFLSFLAVQERDKLDLAREVMKRHREITLFLDAADKMHDDVVAPEEVREIVDKEAKELFKGHDVKVSIDGQGENVVDLRDAGEEDSGSEPGEEAPADIELEVDDELIHQDERVLSALLEARVAAPLERARSHGKVRSLLRTLEDLHGLNDLDAILDELLHAARKLSNADAGSIFLLDNPDTLRFSHVHNDSLFRKNMANAAMFTTFTVPVSEMSIVGFAAKTGKTVVIDDAYRLPRNLPYSFNAAFDKRTGYRTTSILAIPLRSYEDRLVGVMQIINARSENDQVQAFSRESQTFIPLLAHNAASIIERGQANRESVLRMVRLVAMRHPKETEAHAQRVGAYCAEIFRCWAANRAMDPAAARRFMDRLRIAAMLHDLGKLALSDSMAKRKDRTNGPSREYPLHTVQGAKLFAGSSTSLDLLCRDIALHHHERWDGTGFPGLVDLSKDTIGLQDLEAVQPLKGEEIPLPARIAALALAFEDMTRPAPHGLGLSDKQALKRVKQESGRHFDPAVAMAFFRSFRVLKAIARRYAE